MEAAGGFAELKDARDDGFELIEFFADHAHVGAARVAVGEVEAETAVEEF